MPISRLEFENMRSRTERARHTPAQAVEDEVRDLHQPILAWLKANNVPYAYNRPDKKSRATVGQPDFIFPYLGRWHAFECKAQGGELSPAQCAWIRQASDQGVGVLVIHNIEQFREALRL